MGRRYKGYDRIKPPRRSRKKSLKIEKTYDASSIKAAVLEVNRGSTLYKAAKKFSIPWSTLKSYCNRYQDDPTSTSQLKRGKPFVIPSDIEVKLLSYINKMQEIGFVLSVKQIRLIAYRLAEKAKIKHPFSKTQQYAGWYWWASFKKRYNLNLRSSERSKLQITTREIIKEFYIKLEKLYLKLDLQNQPHRIWNLDETTFMFVMKSTKMVPLMSKIHDNKNCIEEKGTSTTIMPCLNVVGDTIPPMIIFKGEQSEKDNKIKNSEFPCLVRLSENGSVDIDLFQEFFLHFIKNITPERPVLLFMDSHKPYLLPEVLELANKEQIHIVAYPPQLTHSLQPLEVGIFSQMKEKWGKFLNRFEIDKPGENLTIFDFLEMISAVYREIVDERLIIEAFAKAGIYPVNYDVIPDGLIGLSSVNCDDNEDISEDDKDLSEDHNDYSEDEHDPIEDVNLSAFILQNAAEEENNQTQPALESEPQLESESVSRSELESNESRDFEETLPSCSETLEQESIPTVKVEAPDYDDGDNSDDEDYSVTKQPNHQKRSYRKRKRLSNEEPATDGILNSNLRPTPYAGKFYTVSIPGPSDEERPINNSPPSKQDELINMIKMLSNEMTERFDQVTSQYNSLCENFYAMKTYMMSIMKIVTNVPCTTNELIEEEDFDISIIKFPCRTLSEFETLESTLKHDPEYSQKVIRKLLQMLDTRQNMVKNVGKLVRYFITRDVALRFNPVKPTEEKPNVFKDTTLYKLIKAALMKTYSKSVNEPLPESKIVEAMSSVLHHCRDWEGGRAARVKKKSV